MNIRVGKEADLPRALELIKELAAYERALPEVTNTLEQMRKDGFGPQPSYAFFVAEADGLIVGLSLYYYRYSTWKGKRLYLEDIIVTEACRGKGVGKALFDRTMEQVIRDGCTGMMWQVLDWNEPSIKFYERYGTRFDKEWINCHLEAPQIQALLSARG